MNDKLTLFYNSLTANPAITGLPEDIGTFKTALGDPARSEVFYNSLKANPNIKGLPDSYKDFLSSLSIKVGGLTPEQPRQSFFEGLGKKGVVSVLGLGEMVTEIPQFTEAVANIPMNIFAGAMIKKAERKGEIDSETADFLRKEQLYPKANFGQILPSFPGQESMGQALADSKLNEWFESNAEKLNETVTRYDQTATEYLKNKQFGNALGAISYGVAESIAPTLAAMFIPGGAAALGLGVGAQKYDEIKDREDMSEAMKMADAVSNGIFEWFFEKFGTAEMGSFLKAYYNKVGGKGLEQAFKSQTMQNLIGKAYKKLGLWFAPLHEGFSEFFTQIGQDLASKLSGESPDLTFRDIKLNAIEAFLIGTGMGGFFSSTTALAKKIKDKKSPPSPLDTGTEPGAIGPLQAPRTQEEVQQIINEYGRNIKFGETPLEEDPNPIVSFAQTKYGKKIILKQQAGVNGDNFFIAIDIETKKPLFIKPSDITERKDIPYQEWFNAEMNNYHIVKDEADNVAAKIEAPVQEGQEITLKDKTFYVSQVTADGISLNEIDEKGNLTEAGLIVPPEDYEKVFGVPTDQTLQEAKAEPGQEIPQEAIQETDEESSQAPQFPVNKEGEIEYKKITEPEMYAQGLQQEFGEDAPAIVDELIAEQNEALKKAQKAPSVIERARKVKAINTELAKLAQVRDIINPQIEVKEEPGYDSENIQGLSSEVGGRQELEQAQPDKETGRGEIKTGGILQEQGKEEIVQPIGEQPMAQQPSIPGETTDVEAGVQETGEGMVQPEAPEEQSSKPISAFKPGDFVRNAAGDVWEVIDIPTDENQKAVLRDIQDGSTAEWNQKTASWTLEKKEVSKEAQLIKAESEVDTRPTEAQKEAGNYKKGHIKWQGMDITIETASMTIREGTDKSGKEWKQLMHNAYGYIRRTLGPKTEGKDQVDVFLGDNLESETVYVIDQVDPQTHLFDEPKTMIGFNSAEEASQAYLANYEPGWKGLGAITPMPVSEFKEWVFDRTKTNRPVDPRVKVSKSQKEQVLSVLQGRIAKKFQKWLVENEDDDFEYYLESEIGLTVNDDGIIDVNVHINDEIDGLLKGQTIYVYHGTSTAVLPDIAQNGLIPNRNIDINRNGEPLLGVYLSTVPSGPAMDGYTYNAVRKLGGEPIVLKVKVEYDKLSIDENDFDIKSGGYQRVINKVGPKDIEIPEEFQRLEPKAKETPVTPEPRDLTGFRKGDLVKNVQTKKEYEVVSITKVGKSFNVSMKEKGTNKISNFNGKRAQWIPIQKEIKVRKKRKGPVAFKPDSPYGRALDKTAESFEEAVMQFLIGGGKLWTKDVIAYVTGKNNPKELKNYIGMYANDGIHMDVLHEHLPNSFGIEDKGAMDEINAIVEVMDHYRTKKSMVKELLRRIDQPFEQELAPEYVIEQMEDATEENIEDTVPETVDNLLAQILASSETMSIFTSGRYFDENNNINWDKLKDLAEKDPEHFTFFPFSLNETEFKNFKTLLNDAERQRELSRKIKGTYPLESGGEGDILWPGTPGDEKGDRPATEEPTEEPAEPEVKKPEFIGEYLEKKPQKPLPTTKTEIIVTLGGRTFKDYPLYVYPDGRVNINHFGLKTLSPDQYEIASRAEETKPQTKPTDFGIEPNGGVNPYLFKVDQYYSDINNGLKVVVANRKDIGKSLIRMRELNEILKDNTLSNTIDYIQSMIDIYDKGLELMSGAKAKREAEYQKNFREQMEEMRKSPTMTGMFDAWSKATEDLISNMRRSFKELSFETNGIHAIKQAINKTADEIQKQYGSLKNIKEVTQPKPEFAEEYLKNHPGAFLKASDGSLNFGYIPAKTGLKEAPIRLTEGNDGHGLLHIIKQHGEEIKKAGYKNVPSFVEDVAKNYTVIRAGAVYNNKPTFLLELIDKQNRTLIVELSRNKEYWTVNSAGIFRKGYSKNKKVVWSAPALGIIQSATADDVAYPSDIKSGTDKVSGNSPQTTSKDKDTKTEENKQALQQKKTEPTVDKTLQGQIDILKRYVEAQVQLANYETKIKELQAIQSPTKAQTQDIARNKLAVKSLNEKSESLIDKLDYTILEKDKADEIKKLIRETIAQNSIVTNRIARLQSERDAKEKALQNRNTLLGDSKIEMDRQAGMQDLFAMEELFQPKAENLQAALKPFNDAIKKAEEEIARNNQLLDEKIDLVLSGAQTKMQIKQLPRTDEKDSDILYRVGDKENPLAINDKFNEDLSRMISGNLKIGHIFELGNPNPILRSAGLPDLPIQLNSSRLRAKSKQEEHPFDLSEITDLPLAIQNPLAVFRSATDIGSYVIFTDIPHKGENFIAAIEVNREARNIAINSIRSVHYKKNSSILNWLDTELHNYLDKKRMIEWLNKQRSNSADVRQSFNHYANIINTFKNPSIYPENNNLFRAIGERGASAVEGLIDYLNVARNMEDVGKSSKEIYLATGWERGKDGKWRHETRDIKLKKDIDFIGKLKTQNEAFTEEVPLTDVIEDEELFNSYPEIKDVKLVFYNYGSHPEFTGTGAFSDFTKKVIAIGTENMAATKQSRSFFPGRTIRTRNQTSLPALEMRDVYAHNRESLIANLSHELQHYIQRIEGFAEGTTRDDAIPGSSSYDVYRLSAGEVEAKNVQQRTKLTPEERRELMLSETEDVARDQQIVIRREFNRQESTTIPEDKNSPLPAYRNIQLQGETLLESIIGGETPNYDRYLADKINELGKSFNTPITIVKNKYELPVQLQWRMQRDKVWNSRVTGIYDMPTETIYVLLDEVKSLGPNKAMEEVTKTVLHEIVAHKGLRELLGKEEYERFLEDLYRDIPQDDRAYLMHEYSTDNKKIIAEEYLAMMAEDNINPTLFQRILAKIRELLRKLFHVSYSKNDIYDMLRRSQENLRRPQAKDYEFAGEYLDASVKEDQSARYRARQRAKQTLLEQAAEAYSEKEKKRQINETLEGIREYFQDFNLPIRRFEEEVLKRGGEQDNESKPYRDLNLSFGRHEKLYNEFFEEKMKPVLDAVAQLKKSGIQGESILPYIICKHAIERNAVMRGQELRQWVDSNKNATFEDVEAQKKALKDKDYSGVMGLNKEGNYTNPDELARDIVKEFESQVKNKKLIDNLWSTTKAATNTILDAWEKGMQISPEQKKEYQERYSFFVPLRGWREGAAKELVYTKGEGFAKSLRHAEGRKSLADNPLAYIQQVAFQAIAEQIDNEVKTSMSNLVIRNLKNNEIHELATIKKLYYVKVHLPDGTFEWEPTINRPAPELFASGEATQKIYRAHERLRAPRQAMEHEVYVHRPGGDIVMIFKGKNLSVAQALNKQNYIFRTVFGSYVDAQDINKAFMLMGHANNMLKAAYTSWNVVFPFTNFMRDFQEAVITQSIKQGTGLKVIRNYKHAFPAIIRHVTGNTDLTNPIDRDLDDFYRFGGATGYTHLKTPEEIEKDINNEIKRMVREGTLRGDLQNSSIKFLNAIEAWNRIFEDATRFAVYRASLAAGNTKEDAAIDAKEASVNFNRKGKGTKAWDAWFAFFNVAIQSMQKNFSLAKHHPGKFSAVALSWISLGFLEAMMNALFDDDEDSSYYNINPYMRQNYLVIPNVISLIRGEGKGDKYLSIPLPQFWRGFKSMGAIGFDIATKRMKAKDGIMYALGNFGSSLLPVDIAGFWKAGEFSFAPIVPTVIKPIIEVAENKNYMGYAIKNEPFTRDQKKILADASLGKKNVSPAAKFFTDMLFRWGGGDTKYKYYYDEAKGKHRKVPGVLDINPSSIEHLFKGYTGGTGGVFSDMITTISQVLDSDEEVDFRNVPFVNRFIRKTPEAKWNIISEYYELRDDSKVTNLLSKEYWKSGSYDKAMSILGDEYLMRYVQIVKHFESALDDAAKTMDYDTIEGSDLSIELMRQCIIDIKDLKEEYGKK